MINTVSWPVYLGTFAGASGVYYLIVGAVLFRRDIVNFLNGSQNPVSTSAASTVASHEEELYQIAKLTSDEIYQLIDKIAVTRYTQEGLFAQIKTILSKAPLLKGSRFQTPITNSIDHALQSFCSIQLSTGQLDNFWNE